MTDDQTTTHTAAENERLRIALADAMQAPHAETVAELVERVRNLDAAFVKEVTEVGRLRAEKSAILTDTGRDFTRLFRALGLVQETDMGEAVEEAGRIYDERDRLREELAGLKADRDQLLNHRAHVRELWEHGDPTGAIKALGFNPAELAPASAVDGGGEKTLAELRAALADPARPAPTEEPGETRGWNKGDDVTVDGSHQVGTVVGPSGKTSGRVLVVWPDRERWERAEDLRPAPSPQENSEGPR